MAKIHARNPKPDSRMSRALLQLAEHESVQKDDFIRLACKVCDTADQAGNLANEAMKRGLIRRVSLVMLTDKGRAVAAQVAAMSAED